MADKRPGMTAVVLVLLACVPRSVTAQQTVTTQHAEPASSSRATTSHAALLTSGYRPLEALRRHPAALPAKLTHNVRLTRDNVLLSRVLLSIASQAGFGISYGEDVARSKVAVSLDATDLSAADALALAVRDTPWSIFVKSTGHVTVTPRAEPAADQEDRADEALTFDFDEYVLPPRLKYDGRTTIARLRYDPVSNPPGCQTSDSPAGPGWGHDYPMSVQGLLKAATALTTLDVPIDSIVLLRASDAKLSQFPLAMVTEPGCWNPSAAEVNALRAYLLKGGFLIVDDFTFSDCTPWYCELAIARFEEWIQRVLPGSRITPIAPSAPIFKRPFQIDPRTVPGASHRPAQIVGIYENNDPSKRLLVVANYWTALGPLWRQDALGQAGAVTWDRTAFRLGLNYLIYGLSH